MEVIDPIVDLKITVPKKYDQNKYNKTFQEKNKDKIKLKMDCPLCFGQYTYFNKSKHNKSIRHKKAELINDEKKPKPVEYINFPNMAILG